jgi:hypothetical protein
MPPVPAERVHGDRWHSYRHGGAYPLVTRQSCRADAATLLVIDVSGRSKVFDQVDLPGRGYGLLELAKPTSRTAAFRDTSGACYSYLDRDDPATISALRQPARQTLLLFALASTELVL